jgi:predicted permease
VRVVTAGFFDTLGLPLRAGRGFAAEDRAGAPKRAIVSESTARQYWPAGDALGSRLTLVWAGGHDAEIVGVVGDARLVRLDAELRPVVYLPAEQSPQNFMTFLVRSASPPASVAAGIRARIAALDPQVAASAVRPMVDVVSASLKRPRFLASLLAAFAALATLLAAVGIYGVVARSVAERRREIGVRMALGGRRVEIFRWVMGRSLRPVLLGAALGLPAALVLGRLVRGLLFGVTPSDPPSLAAALVGLVAVAGLACALPARAALRVEPLEALRPE